MNVDRPLYQPPSLPFVPRGSSAPVPLTTTPRYASTSTSTTPRNRPKRGKTPPPPPVMPPLVVSSSLRIKALAGAIFAGLLVGIAACALVVIVTFMACIPLITEEPQQGTKKTIQYIIEIFAYVFATTTTALISIRTALDVGKEVYNYIIWKG